MRLKTKDIEFTRDESGMHNASAPVILTMPLVLVTGVVLSIIIIQGYIKYSNLNLFCLILLGICIFWSIFSEIYFNFCEDCKVSFKKEYILYEYSLNRSVVASNNARVIIKIYSVENIKIKSDKIKIYGEILRRAPMQKEKKIKSIELPINFGKDKDEIIEMIKKYKSGR